VDLVEFIRPYTKTSPERIAAWVAALAYIDRENIPGDIVECGVWRGGNIILARKLSPDRVCWLYDTFSGMTQPSAADGLKANELYKHKTQAGIPMSGASLDKVMAAISECGVYDGDKLRFVEGDVCETLSQLECRPAHIALLRLDTDWYDSTAAELEYLYPLLSVGGVLIVDDYGHWPGARQAVDDYFGPDVAKEMIDYTACRIIK